jgi:hypothetical protein
MAVGLLQAAVAGRDDEQHLRVEKAYSSITKADTRRHLVANVGKSTWNGRTFLIGHEGRRAQGRQHPGRQNGSFFG